MQEGWNIISFPYLPSNTAISSVLSSLTFGADYDQISYYDPATSGWKHYVNESDFNDFTSFEYGRSYAIYVTHSGGVSFSVTGKSSAVDITFSVKTNENFFSPGVKSATNVTTVLSGLSYGTDYTDVKRYNASTQAFELYSTSAFTQFEPGKGYIIVGAHNCSFSYGKTETTTTFVYDSAGSRVKKTSSGTTTKYFGKDYDITGSTTTKYVFLGDRRLATKDSTGLLLFIHDDHISSSNVVTDSSGNQAALYEYDPYGSTVTHTGAQDLKHRYTGQEADDTTRLYYYGARYYDPQIGRFVTSDPTVQSPEDPQDLNRYAYARNNPIVFTDPTGLGWFTAVLGIIGAIAGGFVTGGAATGFILGGLLYGAIGGVIDSAIGKQNLGKGALQGAMQGAITGASAWAGGQLMGSGTAHGPSEASPHLEILKSTGLEKLKYANPEAADQIIKGGFSKTEQTILGNLLGASLAYAGQTTNSSSPRMTNNPKIESGYKDITYYPPLGTAARLRHTGIKISGTGAYDGEWGFNPRGPKAQFESLFGHTVKGQVFENDGPFYGLTVESTDPDYIKRVYNNIQRSIVKDANKYNLYLPQEEAYNCYTWRDEMLEKKKRNIYDF